MGPLVFRGLAPGSVPRTGWVLVSATAPKLLGAVVAAAALPWGLPAAVVLQMPFVVGAAPLVPSLAFALLVEPGRPAVGLLPGAWALPLVAPWAVPLGAELPPGPHLPPAAPRTPLAAVVLGTGPLLLQAGLVL